MLCVKYIDTKIKCFIYVFLFYSFPPCCHKYLCIKCCEIIDSFNIQNFKDNHAEDETSVTSVSWTFGVNTVGRIIIYNLLVIFVFKTVHRNSEWLSKERLARSGLTVNPTNAKIHVTLGNVLAKKVRVIVGA